MSTEELRRAASRIASAGREAHWRGPDPYDGLWTRWPPPLVRGRRRRQAIVQLHARSPVDIRRLYRRRHSLVPKAPALLGLAALRLYRHDGDDRHRVIAVDALRTLHEDVSCGPVAWGYPWDTQTRWSFYPGGSPNVVVTAFVSRTLAEGAEVLGEPAWLERARAAAHWVLDELFVPGEGFFAYHGHSDAVVHNASLLGAAAVHELAGDAPGAREAVASAVDRVLAAQRPDGTWPYGEAPGLEWVDGFHTGYVLDCLIRMEDVHDGAASAIDRGAAYYATRCFDPEGRALLYPDRPFPEDAHSAGTGMAVLARLRGRSAEAAEALPRVARRALTYVLRPDGHAVHRRERWGATRVTYLRWCDAPVGAGLVEAADALDSTVAAIA